MNVNFRVVLALVIFGSATFLASTAQLADPVVAAGEYVRWDEPVQVGRDLPSSWFPSISTDPTGAVRLAWEGTLVRRAPGERQGASGLKTAIMYAALGSGGWSDPADVQTTDGANAGRATILSDGQWVHLLFRRKESLDRPSLETRLWHSRARIGTNLADARSWSEPQRISNDEAYYSQLAVLPDGRLVVLFNQMGLNADMAVPERRTSVYSRYSSDQGQSWSAPIRVSRGEERVARTALAQSADGTTLLAVWDEGYDNLTGQGSVVGVGTAVSMDGGETWQDQQVIRSASGPIEQSYAAFGTSGPMIVYRSTSSDRVLYRTSVDGGRRWSEESTIADVTLPHYTGAHTFDRLSLVSDGSGRLLLAYVGADPTVESGRSVWVVVFLDGRWLTPRRIAAPDGYPEYPQLCVALGNQVHVVFFVRDVPNVDWDLSSYTLWTVSGISEAKALAPLAIATPAAPATPDRTTRVAPTPPPVKATPLVSPLLERESPQAVVTDPATLTLGITATSLLAITIIILLWRWVRAIL